MEPVKLYIEPELKSPSFIAAWPGMGGVAMIAAKYLKDKLGAKEFGRVEPYDFFDPSVVYIRDNIVEEPQFPESKFYFWESGAESDLIIFIAEAQPAIKGYQFANLTLEVAQRLKAKRVYTFAAAPRHIHHTIKPAVLGVTTNPGLIEELTRNGAVPMGAGNISGLNGLLLGVAKERNMEAICLLGGMPVYMTQIPNPKSSKAALEVLTRILNIEIDMTEIDVWARKTEAGIEGNIEALRRSGAEEAKRLLDYFEQLKQQASVEQPPEFKTEEILKEVERFLKNKREQKGDN